MARGTGSANARRASVLMTLKERKKRGIEVRRVGPMHRVRRPANLDALSGRDALTDPIDDGVIFGVAEFALNE